MRNLSIDIETYSSVDLAKCGVYAYSEAEDFEILLFGYAFEDEKVKVIDLKSGEKLPKEVLSALCDSEVIKTAFNANFERTCLSTYLNMNMPPEQWSCTEVMALQLGLPASLEAVAKCLKLPEQKLCEGKSLIRFFSCPCKASKGDNYITRNIPEDDNSKWNTFKIYCSMDVEVERNIRKQLKKYINKAEDITSTEIRTASYFDGFYYEGENKLWYLDQSINDRGVSLDVVLIDSALACYEEHHKKLKEEAIKLTGLDNPKSAVQMKRWLKEAEGLHTDTLSKENVAKLLKEVTSEEVKRALELRQQLSKTSIKKYEAMKRALCKDKRVRGLLQFYGANRTGRWAGRLVQVQNLPQNKLKDLDLARKLLKAGEYEAIDLLYENLPEVLSQLIRTAFIPSKGSRFIIADFSAIEARIIAWLADESWRMEVFNSHGKIYEASAAVMFKVPIEAITKDSPLRQKGKVAELALGYQGGKGALLAMGATKMGVKEEELQRLVSAWRNANPNIVKLWKQLENAAIRAVIDKTSIITQHKIVLSYEKGILFIGLPSGRRLSYINPRLETDGDYNRTVLTYEGLDQSTKQWTRLKTYGGKLTENIVQAIARDCLAETMQKLNIAGYKIVMHIHDEVVLEVPFGFGSIDEVSDIMAKTIPWAKGLTLRAEVFEADYYKK